MIKINRKLFIAIFIVIILVFILLLFTGCNYQVIDVKYNFDKAIISLPDGTIVEGKLESWRDYDDSDQLQVKIDGITYLVHSNNCVLISNKGEMSHD